MNSESKCYEIIQPHLIEGDLKQFVCQLRFKNKQEISNESEGNFAVLSGKLLQSEEQMNLNEPKEIACANIEESTSE